MSARARSASTCRSTRSSPTTSSRRPWSSPRASRCATGVQARLEKALSRRTSTTLMARVSAAGARAAGRLAAQVPRQRARPDEGARAWRTTFAPGARQQPERAQHQLRLERAGQGDQASRSTRTARARSASARSSWPNNINAVLSGTHDHAVARRHLPDRHRRARRARGARQARDAAQPDDRQRRAGSSVPLAQIATLSYGLEPP